MVFSFLCEKHNFSHLYGAFLSSNNVPYLFIAFFYIFESTIDYICNVLSMIKLPTQKEGRKEEKKFTQLLYHVDSQLCLHNFFSS